MLLDELKHIWKVCFDDDDDYIGLYFSQRYRAENTLVHSEAGRAVAMMTLLPVAIVTPEKVYEGRYVYAVATLPAFRGRGIASALTRRAGLHMKENGTDLAVVVPAASGLFDFYTRQGYTLGLYRRVVTFSAHEIDAAPFLQGTPLTDAHRFYALREQRFGQCGFFVRWDVAALAYIQCRRL